MIDDNDADVPAQLTLAGLEMKSADELQSLLDALAADLTGGRPFDSNEDELATRNWYLQIRTEIILRKTKAA